MAIKEIELEWGVARAAVELPQHLDVQSFRQGMVMMRQWLEQLPADHVERALQEKHEVIVRLVRGPHNDPTALTSPLTKRHLTLVTINGVPL